MFFTKNYQLITIDETDLIEIRTIFNSNRSLLLKHTGADAVSQEWCLLEYRDMLERGFSRYKILAAEKSPAIGFMDFKISEETYLSLLILHGSQQRRGIGEELCSGFEEFVRSHNSKSIRIDVVTDYDETTLGFWLKNGYIMEEEIMLSWGENRLSAQKMIKRLYQ